MKQTVQDKQIKTLYKQGCSDRDIARKIGCDVSIIYNWRELYGLPPNRVPLDYNAVKELYYAGLRDGAIAGLVGCNATVICKWRKTNCLPAQPRHWINYNEVAKLYNLTYTDNKIADVIGCRVSSIRHWRKEHGLDAHGLQRIKVDYEIVEAIYKIGKNDTEIAKAACCSVESVRDWRRRNYFPPNKRAKHVKKYVSRVESRPIKPSNSAAPPTKITVGRAREPRPKPEIKLMAQEPEIVGKDVIQKLNSNIQKLNNSLQKADVHKPRSQSRSKNKT